MDRAPMRTLNRRVLAHFDTGSLDQAPDVLLAPASDFTSLARHAADQKMMQRATHVVGWGGEIPEPGDFTTKDVAGTPVVLIRGKDGEARAFVNACLHRGATVAAGCGNAQRLTCPYHAWSYDTEGRLAGVPDRNSFDADLLANRTLKALPTSEPAGLLVISLDPTTHVEGVLDQLLPELTTFAFSRYSHAETRVFHLRTNWKLGVDVNFEGYHFPYLHKDSLFPFCTNNSVVDTFGDNCRWAFPFRDIVALHEVPEVSWPKEFVGVVVYGLFPSCVLVQSRGGAAQMIRVYPGETPGTCTIYVTTSHVGPILTEEDRAEADSIMEALCRVLCGGTGACS